VQWEPSKTPKAHRRNKIFKIQSANHFFRQTITNIEAENSAWFLPYLPSPKSTYKSRIIISASRRAKYQKNPTTPTVIQFHNPIIITPWNRMLAQLDSTAMPVNNTNTINSLNNSFTNINCFDNFDFSLKQSDSLDFLS